MHKNLRNNTVKVKAAKQTQQKEAINRPKQKSKRLNINKFRCKQIN